MSWQYNTRSWSRRVRFASAAFVLLSLFSAGTIIWFNAGRAHAVSGAAINYEKTDIVNGESQCSSDLAAERQTGDAPRTQVDSSHPYKEIYWVSPQGQPTTGVTATAGSTAAINLQLNGIEFICAIITSPNSGRTTPLSYTLATNSQFPNDRAPNPNGVPTDAASRYQLRTRVKSAQVQTGVGSVSVSVPNQVITAQRNDSSRYWDMNITPAFKYTPPAGGIPGGVTTIKLRFTVNFVYTYNADFGQSGSVTDCTDDNGNDAFFTSSIDYNACADRYVYVTFTVKADNPKINITSTPSCTAISGTAQDGDSPGTQLRISVYDGATLKTTTTTSGAGHNFSVNRSLLGNASDWAAHTYRVHAYGVNSSGQPAPPDTDDNVTVGPCAQVSCGGTSFALAAIRQPITFQVYMDVGGVSSGPPGGSTFNVKVTGPGVNQTYTPAGAPYSGGQIYSSTTPPMTFTPPSSGTYTVAWSYSWSGGSKSGCNGTSVAAYAPYFSVVGGDIMAGTGFGNGSCSESSADITGLNTGTPNYAGAGGEVGAWSSGTITNFVSGMGLGGGTSTQAGYGLSFANTSGIGGTGYGGQYGVGALPCVNDYYSGASAAGSTVGATFDKTDLPATAGTYTYASSASTLTLAGAGNMAVDPGYNVTLYVKGNVYIKHNITYSSYDLQHVPRFNLYVQGNIYIDPNVTELHGVYVAQTGGANTGNIDTCSTVNAGVPVTSWPYATCSKQLLVVGAVAAQGNIALARTYGSIIAVPAGGGPAAPAAPAEIFRFSPEVWLSASGTYPMNMQAYTSLPPVL